MKHFTETQIRFLANKIVWLGVTKRTETLLNRLGFNRVYKLIRKTPEELLALRGLGPYHLGEIVASLEKAGLKLGTPCDTDELFDAFLRINFG